MEKGNNPFIPYEVLKNQLARCVLELERKSKVVAELQNRVEEMQNALQSTREALQNSHDAGMMMESRYSKQKRTLEEELSICKQGKQYLETKIVKMKLKRRRKQHSHASQINRLSEELEVTKKENLSLKKQLEECMEQNGQLLASQERMRDTTFIHS